MLIHYLTLGLKPTASDEEIRKRYLQLVKENPPARAPQRFQKIAAAYEALKDSPSRVRSAVLGALDYSDYESALLELVQAQSLSHRRVGLKELLAAEGLGDGS
ncbi:MAG: J domain-containing protein [Acidobacteriota bacterium]